MNPLRLEYVPLSQAVKWDWTDNAKCHDIGGIVESIEQYGFRDPPEYDATLEAFAQGNGRVQALAWMYDQNYDLPDYVLIDPETKEWLVPVVFGADAESAAVAQAYAIDANNLVITGGDTDLWDMMAIWNQQQLVEIAGLVASQGNDMVTMSGDVLDRLLRENDQEEQDEADGEDVQRKWTILIEFDDEQDLLDELQDLLGPYFMPRSRRKLIPEFFVSMVRTYCTTQKAVAL